ncbi:MAG: hypothetical protein ACK4Y5_06100 [Acetobacteraceae bacterium]|jgi:hypothetical protein|nr:hypothetical protein [Acetobacteraceae bacterium]
MGAAIATLSKSAEATNVSDTRRRGQMIADTEPMPMLPNIPVFDLRQESAPALAALHAAPMRAEALWRGARARYTAPGLALADRASRRWLARNGNPLLPEISAIAEALPGPGGHALNLSYEWGCTAGLGAADAPFMLRVLDWDLKGLGEQLCVFRQAGPAGEWLNLGWPGFAGSITALAPGRFGIAINQPPLPEGALARAARGAGAPFLGLAVDWLAIRPERWRHRGLPPAHLLRLVCDTAPDYAAALAMLRDTPLAAGAIFSLAGIKPGEAAVIERAEASHAVITAAPIAAAANGWQGIANPGAPRWRYSAERHAAMTALLAGPVPSDFGWLKPPIANEGSRLAAMMSPATGRLELLGMEGSTAVTRPLYLN